MRLMCNKHMIILALTVLCYTGTGCKREADCNVVSRLRNACEMRLLERKDDWMRLGTCLVDFKDMWDFDWDEMHVIHGPTFHHQVKKAINSNYSNSISDGFIRVIFTSRRGVACEIEYASSSMRNSTVHLNPILSRRDKFPKIKKSEAFFSVTCEKLASDCPGCCMYVMKQVRRTEFRK